MSNDESLEKTVRHIESVTAEIAHLRDAVASHESAATDLESLAHALARLSQGLLELPIELRSEFAGVSGLVSQLDAALRPAGTLEASVRDLARACQDVFVHIQAEREVMQKEVQALREDVRGLHSLARDQQEQVRKGLDEAGVMIRERATSAEVKVTQKAVSATLAAVNGESEAIKLRLAKLTGLARRGFFALLRGKDAPPEPM